MKKRILCLLLCLLLTAAGMAHGEGETVTLYGREFPLDAKVIDFGGTVITDPQPLLDALPLFTQLEEVDVYESPFERDEWAALYDAAPQIHWGFTLRLASHYFRSDIDAFSTLHSPNATKYASSFYEPLRYCWRLKALDLGHNKITDLDFLSGLTELRVLILADNKVEDLTPLSNLTKLEYLELTDNPGVKDLSPLAACKNMLDLNVSYSKKIKDVDAVLEMPKLRRLYFSSTKENNAHRKEIAETLEARGVKVVLNPYYNSIGSGWREDPHYDVIYELFNTFTYIPFEESEP